MRSLLCGAGRSFSSASTTYPDKWAAAAEKELKDKKPLDSLLFHTPEGITIKPVYGAHDVAEQQIDQGMYIYCGWVMCYVPMLKKERRKSLKSERHAHSLFSLL
jgi:hypothetical protein